MPTIYCVEDDINIRELVLYTLRASGFEAEGFENAEAFFAQLNTVCPDLVLLDIMLPGMDGLSILHSLRETPLTSVLGYAEIIRYGLAKPEDIPSFAVRIHTEAARLLNLVDDIMKLSRLDEGRSTLNFEMLDLHALTNTVCQRLRDRAVQHQVSLAVHGKSCMIRGVPMMVDEVISNLCDNAIKYNRPGGTVQLALTQTSQHIILCVSNTGPAIPAEAQAHIFERFYRADASRSQEIPSTGLGLSIVKHICEIHEASITVTSAPDHTAFRICWHIHQEVIP